MACILVSLKDENILSLVNNTLTSANHTVVNLIDLNPEMSLGEAAKIIGAEKAEAVVMDYWPEDAAGVKLMQTVADQQNQGGPFFIFIESSNEIKREEMVMALNEGARAFLPPNFTPATLLHHLEKGMPGHRGLHSHPKGTFSSGLIDIKITEQDASLAICRTKVMGYQKLVPYLLSTPLGTQNRKVLVVSDSLYQLEMIKKIMEEHSFQVLTATTFEDGVEVAVKEDPHIIISDLELGESSGVSFCQEVKLIKKVAPCYFVICTANQAKLDKIMVPGNGVDDCLLKPANQHDTADFVSRVAMGLLV